MESETLDVGCSKSSRLSIRFCEKGEKITVISFCILSSLFWYVYRCMYVYIFALVGRMSKDTLNLVLLTVHCRFSDPTQPRDDSNRKEQVSCCSSPRKE